MWTKEQANSFLKRTLGLELTDAELNGFWNHLNENKLTPVTSGDNSGNNVGFSPLMLQNLINAARERTGLTLQSPRFKKVSEEIMPALALTLLLKKINRVEHLIVSSDVPDIALVKFDPSRPVKTTNRLDAFPIEAIFINRYAMDAASGNTDIEKVSDVIVSKKFIKQYIPQTTLLITLSVGLNNFNFSELSRILSANPTNPFHQIWVFSSADKDNCLMAQLSPTFEAHVINIPTDLMPLIY